MDATLKLREDTKEYINNIDSYIHSKSIFRNASLEEKKKVEEQELKNERERFLLYLMKYFSINE